MTRRALHLTDLEQLAAALRAPGDAVFAAAEALAADVIGHKLFTINLFDAARFEVARVHTSDPSVYPVGGRKQKARTAWGEQVLTGCQVFLAADADAVRAAFDDHATIFGLGIGAILNIPVCLDGRCVGTMNLCHEAHWFTQDDVRPAQLIAAFLTAPLAQMQA
jgi:GAF domain-containing protein